MMSYDLKAELARIKRESFTAGAEPSDEDAMGLLISRYFKWDGVSILKAAANALEDANFHDESAQIDEMIKKIGGGK